MHKVQESRIASYFKYESSSSEKLKIERTASVSVSQIVTLSMGVEEVLVEPCQNLRYAVFE